MNKKIALIGAGNIGGSLAMLLVQAEYQEIVLFDFKPGLAQGKALDLAQAGALMGSASLIRGTQDYSQLNGCDLVIVTAGSPRLPGMSRDDLLEVNAKVMIDVGAAIRTYCSQAITICVTNPLDSMVYVLQKAIGSDPHRTMGMAGVLDSARMSYFISQHFHTSVKNVETIVMGGHGDNMVPVSNRCRVFGESLDFHVKNKSLTQQDVDGLMERTRQGGGEIVQLLQTGSAFYAPAVSVFTMIQAIAKNQHRLLPVAAFISSEYKVPKPIYLGVPAILGANGVEKVVSYELTASQQEQLDHSSQSVCQMIVDLERLGFV